MFPEGPPPLAGRSRWHPHTARLLDDAEPAGASLASSSLLGQAGKLLERKDWEGGKRNWSPLVLVKVHVHVVDE